MRTAEELSEIVNRHAQQAVHSLSGRHIDPYLYIKRTYPSADISVDDQFQRVFRGYYTMRFPSKQWAKRFFDLFQEQKKTRMTFAELSRELYQADHIHQFSFITKMLHTLDDAYPIFDSKIGHVFGIRRRAEGIERQIEEDEELVRYMQSVYRRLEMENLVPEAMQTFELKFPNTGISFVKKADFLLWACADMEQFPDIRPGRYQHFKGKEYEVLYVAAHSETREPMVVYRALYGDRGVWVRPAAMWNETVIHDGRECPRFAYIGV